MKRTISILLAAVMLFAVGCGKQGEKNIDTDSLDIDEFYESIGSMTNEELVTLDDTYISNYYGINIADLDGYVFAQSEDPNSAESVIIFKCKDETKRSEYVKAVQNAIVQKIDELKNYGQPEQAKLAEDCSMSQIGDLVYAVISPNAEEICSALEGEL